MAAGMWKNPMGSFNWALKQACMGMTHKKGARNPSIQDGCDPNSTAVCKTYSSWAKAGVELEGKQCSLRKVFKVEAESLGAALHSAPGSEVLHPCLNGTGTVLKAARNHVGGGM